MQFGIANLAFPDEKNAPGTNKKPVVEKKDAFRFVKQGEISNFAATNKKHLKEIIKQKKYGNETNVRH